MGQEGMWNKFLKKKEQFTFGRKEYYSKMGRKNLKILYLC